MISSRPTPLGERGNTYPTSERLKGIHRLIVLGLVLAKFLVNPDSRLERSTPLRAPRSSVVAVALQVADLLVKLEAVSLQRLDLRAEARDCLELLAEFLWV